MKKLSYKKNSRCLHHCQRCQEQRLWASTCNQKELCSNGRLTENCRKLSSKLKTLKQLLSRQKLQARLENCQKIFRMAKAYWAEKAGKVQSLSLQATQKSPFLSRTIPSAKTKRKVLFFWRFKVSPELRSETCLLSLFSLFSSFFQAPVPYSNPLRCFLKVATVKHPPKLTQ